MSPAMMPRVIGAWMLTAVRGAKPSFGTLRFIGELGRRLWVCEAPGGTLVVVDPHAVLERLKLHQLTKGASMAQRTLFSAAVELAPEDVQRIVQMWSELLEQNGPPPTMGLTQEEVFGLFAIRARPKRIGTAA